jgi:hypothetical protein
MPAHPPPVPPDQRAPHGSDKQSPKGEAADHRTADRNTKEQGRQGNLAQNTTNQGLQQDR